MLLEELKKGEESYPVAIPDPSGGVEELPCAVAMKKVLKRQIDFSKEASENFLRRRR
jgi:hypothetical protein